MHSIIVTKSGSVFRTRDAASTASAVGENGETEGILRHLAADKRLRVIYFGKWRGGEIPGVTVVEADTNGLSELSTGDEQRTCFDNDVQRLLPYAPFIGLINVSGLPPTFSHIDNPNGAFVQSAAVHYTAPMLNVLQHFKLKRCVVNNDPRSYPRDQEMSMGWPHCRPVALLDQCNTTRVTTIGGRSHRRVSVYARCESWGYLPKCEMGHSRRPALCIAHAHIADGIKKGSEDAWDVVLDGTIFPVYGRGWQKTRHYDDSRWMREVPATDVAEHLATAKTCPIVAHTPGFYTGKPYVCLASGCLPLLFGRGEHTHTWDMDERYISHLHERLRFSKKGELQYLISEIDRSEELRRELLEEWTRIAVPDWSKLDSLIDKLIADTEMPANEFGGYLVSR